MPERGTGGKWDKAVRPASTEVAGRARPGLCFYLLLYLQGTLALGPPHLHPKAAFWGGLGLPLRGAHEERFVLLQEVSELSQLPADEIGGVVHFAHAPQQAQHQGPAALLTLAPGVAQFAVAVVACALYGAQGGPTAQWAPLLCPTLTVLPVFSQGPTWHPYRAALVGAGLQLERAGVLVPPSMGQGARHQAASFRVLALRVGESTM